MWRFVSGSTDRRKSVAGVGDEHASLANGTVTHSDTLDEPGRTHCYSMFIFLEDKPWLMMIHEAIVQCMLCWRRKKTRELVCVLEKGEKRNWIWCTGGWACMSYLPAMLMPLPNFNMPPPTPLTFTIPLSIVKRNTKEISKKN